MSNGKPEDVLMKMLMLSSVSKHIATYAETLLQSGLQTQVMGSMSVTTMMDLCSGKADVLDLITRMRGQLDRLEAGYRAWDGTKINPTDSVDMNKTVVNDVFEPITNVALHAVQVGMSLAQQLSTGNKYDKNATTHVSEADILGMFGESKDGSQE